MPAALRLTFCMFSMPEGALSTDQCSVGGAPSPRGVGEIPGPVLGLLRFVARVPRWPGGRACFAVATGVRRVIFTRTNYDALNDRIAKTRSKLEELLTVLSTPAVPFQNNASELGARVSARRRDVSLHSRSERGVRAMDIGAIDNCPIANTRPKENWPIEKVSEAK